MYNLYLFGKQMPVEPAKLTLKINNKNSTLDLLNGDTINFLKSPGLTDISLSLCFPMFGKKKPDYYLGLCEKFKIKKKPTQLILTRTTPDGQTLFDSNIKVSVEDYKIVEDHKKGLDVNVDISLRQYKDYGTQTFEVKTVTVNGKEQTVAKATKSRETSNAPQADTYKVKKGDTLWSIAAKYLGTGSKYKELLKANKDVLTNPNLLKEGMVLKIPK